jgi:alcohol dehydrogenase
MRAAHIYEYGAPDVFRVEQADDPDPGPGQVLIEVHAAGINPIDYKMREGNYRLFVRYKMPRILGLDVSGVIKKLGAGVTEFKVGDEVYASPRHDLPGCYAEMTCVRVADLALKPKQISHQQAAGLPLVFETAWQSLVDSANLQEGEHCFIQAGSGGVGSVAIQIAKDRGAKVTTTCSSRNHELVRRLGADNVIDYHDTRFEEALSDMDVCLDTLGVDSVRVARGIMRRGGRIVGITPNLPAQIKRWGPFLGFIAVGLSIASTVIASAVRGVKTRFVTRVPSGDTLRHCNEMIERGALEPVVDKVFPLEDIVEAHRYIETGRARGKIVLSMR